MTFEEATFVEPVNTCLKAIEKARVAPGETVVVMGQGPIGLLLMMLARLAGATVLTSDPMPERRAVSERLGAAAAFDPSAGIWRRKFARAPMAAAPTSCWWPCRLPAALTEGLALARPGGRVLLFAQNDPHMKIEFPAAAVGVEEKEILGSYSAAVDRQDESARLVFSRTLPVAELVTHRFPLEEFEQALSWQLGPKPIL